MRGIPFLLLLALCCISLDAQEDTAPPKASEEVSVILEVIGYHPRFSKTWFEGTTGERWEIYHDLLGFKVLEPKEHAGKALKLLLPTMGGTYHSPTVEYQERINVRVKTAPFAELLNQPQSEHHPARSLTIEHAIHSAIIVRKKAAAPSEQPSP